MVVHPEVGKWLIALGEKAFGMDPFGWRIAAAVVGSLMVLVMCRFVRRVTGSTLLGCVGGLLLSLDGLHLVLSRLALLDIFLAFFLLCAVHCLVADRDWLRRRLAATRRPRRHAVTSRAPSPGDRCGGCSSGPGCSPEASASGWPWARSGRRSTRWRRSGSWCGPGAPGARRSFGVRWPVLRSALVDGVPAFVHLVGVGLVVYVATWTGWLVHAERVRGAPLRDAVHDVRRRPAVADRDRARRRRPRRGRPVAAVAVVLPPGRLRLPHPLPQRLRPPLRVQARRAGC